MNKDSGRLVVSRKPKQKVIIGDDIIVEVVAVSGDCVTVAITAPKDVSVHREEVYQRILRAHHYE